MQKSNKYGADISFLSKCGVTGVELTSEEGAARVFLVPAWQGRVVTSTASGVDGESFGWINRSHIVRGAVKRQFNPFGGEERLWLGPEGGPFSFYFAPGAQQSYENWRVPAPLDTEPFEVVEKTDTRVCFSRRMTLRNAFGTRFKIGVNRCVELLSISETGVLLGGSVPKNVSLVAYRSNNAITNCGASAWTPHSGAPSVWMLGMFPPTSSTTVFIPCTERVGGECVRSDYFGKLPEGRLSVKNGLILFRIDGKLRAKIGVSEGCDTGFCGSYDSKRSILTLIYYRRSPGPYVDSRWGVQKNPFAGDVVNAYNDGPTETGEVMGPFYEIETSSPAAFLSPGETLCHTQTVVHLQGDGNALETLLCRLIPCGFDDLKTIFES